MSQKKLLKNVFINRGKNEKEKMIINSFSVQAETVDEKKYLKITLSTDGDAIVSTIRCNDVENKVIYQIHDKLSDFIIKNQGIKDPDKAISCEEIEKTIYNIIKSNN